MIKKSIRTELDYTGFEKYLLFYRNDKSFGLGGLQYVFKFKNGYGASVVKHHYSYGGDKDLWEVTVLDFEEDGRYESVYDTPITDDVVGYCPDSKVRVLLSDIKSLKRKRRKKKV